MTNLKERAEHVFTVLENLSDNIDASLAKNFIENELQSRYLEGFMEGSVEDKLSKSNLKCSSCLAEFNTSLNICGYCESEVAKKL